jgi:hypothetical protein
MATLIPKAAPQSAQYVGLRAFLLGLGTFALLWILSIPYRTAYVPNGGDIPALADGLLLAPGAHWQDWFTRGYLDFWDRYPEWPLQVTGFTRPAFQFAIYLAHFAFGRDWASYQVISCFAVAGLAAVTFQIAQTALGLRTAHSLFAAMLVVISPPVLQSWIFGLAFAIEPLATVFVAGAFLAVLARRDFLCLIFLFAALLTKENAMWAPFAAALTIMLHPRTYEPLCRRGFAAAIMLLPVAMWLGLRFTFFGGLGGTYATAGYTPLGEFLSLTLQKLENIHLLLVSHFYFGTEGRWVLLDRAVTKATSVLVYALLLLWALRVVNETLTRLRSAVYEGRWPTANPAFLVSLWAVLALAFHFALPIAAERYATSFVVFVWPALVAEVQTRQKKIIWLGIVLCGVVALIRSSGYAVAWCINSARIDQTAMDTVLREVPTRTRQIYVLPVAESLQDGNPKYVRLILDVPAEIVRIADVDWKCGRSNDLVTFDHIIAGGIVSLTITLPECAKFRFINARFTSRTLSNGYLDRNAAMSYELPEAYPVRPTMWEPPFFLGRKMAVHVRPNGPARFIIDHGRPDGMAWFDTP